MYVVRIGSETIIRLRAPMAISERDGATEYRDWDNATEVVFERVMVQPFKMAEKLNFEVNENREHTRTAYRFMILGDHDFDSNDRILWGLIEFEIFGHPQKWYRFNGDIKYTGFIGRVQEG